MTYQEINQMVESIGLSCAYYQFTDKTAKKPPFVVWFFTDSNDAYADNSNYVKIPTLNIELYTRFKDFEKEALVEEVLEAHGLTWYKEENYIETEKIWQIAYESEVVING